MSSKAEPRALIVSTFVLPHLGGVEMFSAWAAKELADKGFKVRTLAGAYPGAEAEAVVPVITLFGGRWPVPRGGLRTIWREVGAADVVLANGHHYPLPLLAVLLARLRRKPVVFVLHGADDSMADTPRRLALVRLWNRYLARPVLKLATVVALSEVGRDYARRELGVQAQVVPYPLPDDLPVAQPRTPGAPQRVVWAGRLVPEKSPLAAVEAVEALPGERHLDVYGDGPLRTPLERLATTRPWLHLHGRRPLEEVWQAMSEADVFLATSRVDNVYVAALEALAIGTPTVATRVGEVPRYYSEQLARFCVDDELTAALVEALDPRWRDEFAANARRLREQHRGDALLRIIEEAS